MSCFPCSFSFCILRLTNDDFVSAVKRIEENPKCQMLRMDSFLMLPMQRITRLPLLVNAVIQRTQSLKEKAMCEEALASLTNVKPFVTPVSKLCVLKCPRFFNLLLITYIIICLVITACSGVQ